MEYIYTVESSYRTGECSGYSTANGIFTEQSDAEQLKKQIESDIVIICRTRPTADADSKTKDEYSKARQFDACHIIKSPLNVAFDYKDIKPECI